MEKREIFINLVQELKNQTTDSKVEKIATNLETTYNIPKGVTISLVNREHNDKFFKSNDVRLLTLFIMEAFKVLGRGELIDKYIPIGEQQESKQYDHLAYSKSKKAKLPITYKPAIPVNEMYSTVLTATELSDLLNAGIVNYNFDIQREAKLEIRTDEIVKRPTINQRNVNEMTQHLLNDTLRESTIVLNAAPLTSKEGDEILYNSSDYSITITEGTRIDVLDGFHRILAAQSATLVNPNIEFEFNVLFANFTTAEAIKWQAQHSKATPWSKNRVTELQQDSKASKVVKLIREQSDDLQTLIFTGKNKGSLRESLITYEELTNIINKHYIIETRRDEVKIAEQLAKALLITHEASLIHGKNVTQNKVIALLEEYIQEGSIEFLENLLELMFKEGKEKHTGKTESKKQINELSKKLKGDE